MMSEPFAICERCRERVDPDDPSLIRAAKVVRTAGFKVGVEEDEGMPVLFHESCWDEDDPRYMRRSG
jgi:hypothetical protein